MEKPKGGRGNKASYSTRVVRLPKIAAFYGNRIADNARDLMDKGREEDSLYYSSVEKQEAISYARSVLTSKKSAKHSMEKLLQFIYGFDVSL